MNTQTDHTTEEFLAMIRRDAAQITDPGEMLAMARVIEHVLGDD